MPYNIFTQLVADLSRVGFYEFLLPWLLSFAIVYGLLIKAKLFGDVNKKVSGVLAIVIAFFVSAYSGPLMADYFTTLFAGSATVMAAVLVVVLLAALVGFKMEWQPKNLQYGTMAVLIAIGVVLFLVALGTSWLQWNFWTNSWITGLFVVLLILAAVAFIMSGDEKSSGGSASAGKPS